jgi:histidine triad (HIT) family protein
MSAPCLFCDVVTGREGSHRVAESAGALAFLDRHPINPGHTLIVPKRHSADYFDMAGPDAAAVFDLAHGVARLLRKAFGGGLALNLIMSNGEAAEQSVFHSHVHLIPRLAADGFAFQEEPRPSPSDADLAAVSARLRGASA